MSTVRMPLSFAALVLVASLGVGTRLGITAS